MEQGGSSRRNSKTYAVDEAFFSDDNSAALGGTSCLVHGYVAAGVALAMTVPFLPFMPWWTNSPTNPYTNMTHSQERFYKEWGKVSEDCVGVVVVETRPIDATLWAPYAASTSQDEIYIAVYLLSALLLALFLAELLNAARQTPTTRRRPRSRQPWLRTSRKRIQTDNAAASMAAASERANETARPAQTTRKSLHVWEVRACYEDRPSDKICSRRDEQRDRALRAGQRPHRRELRRRTAAAV